VTVTPTWRSDQVRDQRSSAGSAAAPRELIEELPLSEEHVEVLLRGRSEVQAILDGRDDRLLVVVGPCSIHDVDASLAYAEQLAAQMDGCRRTCAWRCGLLREAADDDGWKG